MRIKQSFSAVLFFLTAFITTATIAEQVKVVKPYEDKGERFYDGKDRGFFAYEKLPIEIIELIKHQRKQIKDLQSKVSKEKKVKPLSAEWLRQNLDTYRDKAIDTPNEDNMLAYRLLEKITLEKSHNFATASMALTAKYPSLDSNALSPTTSSSSLKAKYMSYKSRHKIFRKLGESKGFLFFYDSTCSFCDRQAKTLDWIKKDFGFETMAIALDGKPLPSGHFAKNFVINPAMAMELNVMTTPAIFVIDPKTKVVANISQGEATRETLIERTVLAAKNTKWITDAEFNNSTYLDQRLRLNTDEIMSLKDVDMTNPVELNKYLLDVFRAKGVSRSFVEQ